ncbi:MAG TPA: hypothetical protein VF525_17695 [Pyrinomonadaceae bacterium]|jgi:hypothetical protein
MTHYDRFKDETTVGVMTTLESYRVEIPFADMQEFLNFFAGFTHQGQRLATAPDTVKLVFQSQARAWRFLDAPELYGIIDGERVDFGRMSNTRVDLGAGHIETLRLSVSTPTFLKLARAKSAELRVGGKEVRLSLQNMAALSSLADAFTRPTKQPSPRGSATDVTAPSAKPIPALKPPPQVSQPVLESTAGAPVECPIKISQLLPYRGFRLGMTLTEVNERFRGDAPSPSNANSSGVRSMEVNLIRSNDAPGSTRLIRLDFKFLNERLYRITGTYSVGKEWKGRPMSEYAVALSHGLGTVATWAEVPERGFSAPCGEVRFDLEIDDETFTFAPPDRGLPMASAFFTVTDVAAEAQIKQRNGAVRRQQKQLDAEKRKVFKP